MQHLWSIIRVGELLRKNKAPFKELILVVNEKAQGRESETLAKFLRPTGDPKRDELRHSLNQTFQRISKYEISYNQISTFGDEVAALHQALFQELPGNPAQAGKSVADDLSLTLQEVEESGLASIQEITEESIRERLFKPKATKILEAFKASLPDVEQDYYANIEDWDTREQFVCHLEAGPVHAGLVSEVRKWLREKLDEVFERTLSLNKKEGEKELIRITDTKEEQGERRQWSEKTNYREGRIPGIGIPVGRRRWMHIVEQDTHHYTRTITKYKNGREQASPWVLSHTTTKRTETMDPERGFSETMSRL